MLSTRAKLQTNLHGVSLVESRVVKSATPFIPSVTVEQPKTQSSSQSVKNSYITTNSTQIKQVAHYLAIVPYL